MREHKDFCLFILVYVFLFILFFNDFIYTYFVYIGGFACMFVCVRVLDPLELGI